MALEEFPSPPDPEHSPLWLEGDPVDTMLARYIEWHLDARSVAEAYERWRQAAAAESDRRFSAYLAWLDHEEASAKRYAVAVADVEGRLGIKVSR